MNVVRRARPAMLVRCVPGLEGHVQEELRVLGVTARPTSFAGTVVALKVTDRQLYAANALLRCASRILVPACSFAATSLAELELAAKGLRSQHATLEGMLIPGARLKMSVKATPRSRDGEI